MNKILLTLILLSLTTVASAGVGLHTLTETTKIMKLDEIAEQVREAKKSTLEGLSNEELDKMLAKAEEVLKSGSSPLVQKIVTWERVRLMQNMKENRYFIEQMAHTMRSEFKGEELSQYEHYVRIALRRAETDARDGKSLDRILGILGDISNSASSPVGASIQIGSMVLR